ncbi:MAG: metallophosphoesterase family protein [Thermoplasmatales archaeon]
MKVLIFSDIHANIYALKALLAKENFDQAIFLGDIVDYGTSPAETIDIVRNVSKHVISGNHDYAAAFGKDCLCSQENHDLSVYTRENITMKNIGKEDVEYLRSLPVSLDIDIDGREFHLFHGSPSDPLYGYLFPWNLSERSLIRPGSFSPDSGYFIIGHTHYQFFINFKGNAVINPGSSGQPRDGNPLPSYAIYDSSKDSFEFKRFSYPKEKLKNDLKREVKDEGYLNRLINLFSL